MSSESSTNEPNPSSTKQPTTADPPTPPSHPQPDANRDSAVAATRGPPHDRPFGLYPHGGVDSDPSTEPGGGMNVPVPYPGMPVYPYGNVIPPPPMTRPKRTQCKNACTNCQKACKKCDDNRPCHRCIRYGTTETCVDSKRKERKKGVKRGPYKKRDSKGHSADVENDDGSGTGSTGGTNGAHGPGPNMPYVGPVGYPPGMWSSYSPGGPGAKLEGGGYYQPVFALTPVGGQPPHGGDGENVGGGGGSAPHFPVGFYPATFISYPGPYPPYPMPQGQGSPPHGFHYAYPPPPGVYQTRPPHVGSGNANGEQGAASGSADKNVPDAGAAAQDKSDEKEATAIPETQVNGTAKVATETQVNGTAGKEAE